MGPRVIGVLLLWALASACSAARVVRLDTGRGPPLVNIPRADEAGPVEVKAAEFAEALTQEVRRKRPPANPELAARELLGVPSHRGDGDTRSAKSRSAGRRLLASQWADVAVRMTQQYLRFCAARGKPGDCRRALMNNAVLTEEGRYVLAMSFALEEVIPEMMQAFKDMADPEAIKASILWTMTLYAAMWIAPEPVFSKGLATVVTATFVCYIGVDTFWTLIQGWRRLVESADLAISLSEIYARLENSMAAVLGKNSARAFALLLTAAIGQTASSFSAKVPTLPGSAQAAAVGAAQAGVRLTDVAQVECRGHHRQCGHHRSGSQCGRLDGAERARGRIQASGCRGP